MFQDPVPALTHDDRLGSLVFDEDHPLTLLENVYLSMYDIRSLTIKELSHRINFYGVGRVDVTDSDGKSIQMTLGDSKGYWVYPKHP